MLLIVFTLHTKILTMYKRIIEKTLNDLLDSREILIIYGPRKAGKKTLLQIMYKETKKAHPTAIYSLEDPNA